MEKFVVFNPNSAVVSFQLRPLVDLEKLVGMARHKVRRLVRGGFLPVLIKAHTSLDLVEYSGMSVEALKGNIELHRLIRKGALQLMETTLVEEVSDEEIEVFEILEVLDEVKEEPPKFPSVPKDEEVPKKVKKKKGTKFFKKASKEG